MKKPTGDLWFTSKPIGHNVLNQTVARLCSEAGIGGYRTNHSLRATVATRLYQAGIDEQLIMERTGHRSLEGVRSYKHTSEGQKEAVSDILHSRPAEQPPHAQSQALGTTTHSLVQYNTATNNHSQVNVQQHIRTAQSILPPTFNFHSCTVNINYGASNQE